MLLLIVPDSAHTQYTPITLGTLHIDMAIRLATEEELETLNKLWQRSLVATKLTMKEAKVLDVEEAQIIPPLDSNVKLIRDTIVGPFAAVETKGILRKTPNHYKRMNVVVDNLEERRSYKDIAVVSQLQILKPGSDRISIVLQNLTNRTLKLKKGMNVAHVEASQVVPLFEEPLEKEDVSEEVTGYINRGNQFENLTQKKGKKNVKDSRKDRSYRYRILDGTTMVFG